MAKKQIAGVSGVLGGLISEDLRVPKAAALKSTEDARRTASSSRPPPSFSDGTKLRARLGRPPGKRPDSTVVREKLTVRIDARLTAAYRDWSWEARCQLGELVETALEEYLAQHRRQ